MPERTLDKLRRSKGVGSAVVGLCEAGLHSDVTSARCDHCTKQLCRVCSNVCAACSKLFCPTCSVNKYVNVLFYACFFVSVRLFTGMFVLFIYFCFDVCLFASLLTPSTSSCFFSFDSSEARTFCIDCDQNSRKSIIATSSSSSSSSSRLPPAPTSSVPR